MHSKQLPPPFTQIILKTKTHSYFFITLILLLALSALSLISLGVGAVSLTPAETLLALRGEPVKASHQTIVRDFRLARVLLVILSGASLSAAGVGFQGLFRNPLADPYIVGASSGAALGATLSAVLRGTAFAFPIGVGAFFGALISVIVVFMIAEVSNFGSIAGLLLAGAAMSAMLSALVSLLLMLSDEVLHEIFVWLLGGFSGRSWSHLNQALRIAPVGILIIALMSRALDAFATGEESAQALGLDLPKARILVVTGASLATAAAVSVSGVIGFIGLIAPHLARTLVGAKHGRLLPIAMLLGSLLLLFSDGLARTIMAPMEMPVGVFTALLGGPFFLYLLRRGRNA